MTRNNNWKWKPSKSQKKAFAEKMANDPDFAAAYEKRKLEKIEKRRAGSKFNYPTAGGWYVPTVIQFNAAFKMLADPSISWEQNISANSVFNCYLNRDRAHHDYIHVVNEWIRSQA